MVVETGVGHFQSFFTEIQHREDLAKLIPEGEKNEEQSLRKIERERERKKKKKIFFYIYIII